MSFYNKLSVFVFCYFVLLPNIAKAEDYHGAIYVNQATGIAGTAYNFSSKEKASANALQICKKKSGKKSCKAILTWKNGCGAAAWSPKNRSARSEMSETVPKVAESKALDRCISIENDPSCKIVASACTNWETWETTTTTTWW